MLVLYSEFHPSMRLTYSDLENKLVALVVGGQRVENGGQLVGIKLDVDNSSNDLMDLALL